MTKSGADRGLDPKQALDAAMAMMGNAGGDPAQEQAASSGRAVAPRKSTVVEVGSISFCLLVITAAPACDADT